MRSITERRFIRKLLEIDGFNSLLTFDKKDAGKKLRNRSFDIFNRQSGFASIHKLCPGEPMGIIGLKIQSLLRQHTACVTRHCLSRMPFTVFHCKRPGFKAGNQGNDDGRERSKRIPLHQTRLFDSAGKLAGC